MTLKYTVGALSDVPAEFHDLYAKSDDRFVLQVEDAEPRHELDYLRASNISARQEIEAITAKFQGVDPGEWRRLLRQDRAQRDWEMFQEGRGDEVIAERVAPMKTEHGKLMATVIEERDATKGEVDAILIDTAIRDAAVRAEVQPCAMEDVLRRGRQTFHVEDGKLVAYQGDAPLLGRHGPLGVPEWVAFLIRSAPHMFAASASGNAPGGSQQRVGQGATIRRSVFDRLGPQEKAAAARSMKIID